MCDPPAKRAVPSASDTQLVKPEGAPAAEACIGQRYRQESTDLGLDFGQRDMQRFVKVIKKESHWILEDESTGETTDVLLFVCEIDAQIGNGRLNYINGHEVCEVATPRQRSSWSRVNSMEIHRHRQTKD